MAARITNADLLAALTSLVSVVTSLDARVSAVEAGQFTTSAPVANLTVAREAKANKGNTGTRPLAGAALAKHEAKIAREASMTPAQRAAADQAKAQAKADYLASKGEREAAREALKPLNKAFHALICANGVKSGSDEYKAAWDARMSNKSLLAAALKALTPAEAKAAKAALAK